MADLQLRVVEFLLDRYQGQEDMDNMVGCTVVADSLNEVHSPFDF